MKAVENLWDFQHKAVENQSILVQKFGHPLDVKILCEDFVETEVKIDTEIEPAIEPDIQYEVPLMDFLDVPVSESEILSDEDNFVDDAEGSSEGSSDELYEPNKGLISEKKTLKTLGKRKRDETSEDIKARKKRDMVHKCDEMEETIRKFNKLICELCPAKNLSSYHEVMKHYQVTHKVSGYIQCCGLKFMRRYKIYNHIIRHLNPSLFKCELCPKQFETRYGLKHHQEGHLPDEMKKFQCDQCASRFYRLAKLNHHIANTHVPEEKKNFKCPTCAKAFVTKYSMEDHHRKMHDQLRPFVCEICAKDFKTKQNLIDHVITHDPMRRKVKCEECGKLYQNDLQLKRHKKRVHTNGELCECPHCGVHAKNQCSLTAHINLAHKIDPNKHQCSICGKGFKKAKTLKVRDGFYTIPNQIEVYLKTNFID